MVMIKSFALLSKPVTLTFASEVSDQVETSTPNKRQFHCYLA